MMLAWWEDSRQKDLGSLVSTWYHSMTRIADLRNEWKLDDRAVLLRTAWRHERRAAVVSCQEWKFSNSWTSTELAAWQKTNRATAADPMMSASRFVFRALKFTNPSPRKPSEKSGGRVFHLLSEQRPQDLHAAVAVEFREAFT